MFGPRFWRFGNFSDWLPEVQRLQDDMNRVFSGYSAPAARDYPLLNVWLHDHDALVTAELPGIDPDKLDIAVSGDQVTISGTREQEVLKKEETYHRRERRYGPFTRTLKLPFKIDPDHVDARYEKGILEVRLPCAQEEKPRKIEIKSA